jgi:hypothetical protein
MSLTLIYRFQTSQNQAGDFKPASYCVVYLFSEEGFLEEALLKELSKTVPDADHDSLTFLSLDDLKAFALRVAQEFSVREVRLISVQDYNIGLDGARDLKSFQSIFNKYGDVILNESVSKKKGLFSKIFG